MKEAFIRQQQQQFIFMLKYFKSPTKLDICIHDLLVVNKVENLKSTFAVIIFALLHVQLINHIV